MDLTSRVAIRRAQAALDVAAGPSHKDLASDYLRSVIARAVAKNHSLDAAAYAEDRWGRDARPAMIVKAAVAGSDAGDLMVEGYSPRDAFFRLVVERAIVGRLTQARRVGFNVRTISPELGALGYWVAEGKPVPVSRLALDGEALPTAKVGALIIATNESLADPASEGRVIDDLTRACVLAIDQAFVDPVSDGEGDSPAAVTADVDADASTGNPGADLELLAAGFEGDLTTAVLVTDPLTATQAAFARDAAGAFMFPNLGPLGGSAAGIPVMTSSASPRGESGGQWALIDQAGIAVALESLSLARSQAASIAMSDDPQEEPGLVSLFQSEATAFLATLRGNWRPVRAGAVSLVTGADYATELSTA